MEKTTNLSEEQMKIVNKIDGQMLCVACPGSGKTTVIIERIKHMIESDVRPDSILVITFTKKAAEQMQERFEKRFGKTTVFFGTIHSLCFNVVKQAYRYTGSNILKPNEVYSFFYSILFHKVKTDSIDEYIKNLIGEISFIRNKGITPRDYTPEHSRKEDFLNAFSEYEEFKKEKCKIDFDDMLWLCLDVFRKSPEHLAYWQQKFQYIMIDEYQDTNKVQAEIFYALAGENGNLCVVGDDDQSVYRFRAADSRVFLDFPKKYPNAEKFFLSTNYRSCPEVITYAGNLIQHNQERFKKQFLVNRKDRGSVEIVNSENEFETGCMTVIKKLSDLQKSGANMNEVAVLYRTNIQSHSIAAMLLRMKVPFYCTEPLHDYHSDFIFGDIMAYYRLANDQEQKGDLCRVINRPSRFLKTKDFEKCKFDIKDMFSCCDKAKNPTLAKSHISEMYHDIKRMKGTDTKTFFLRLEQMGYADEFLKSHAAWCQKDPSALKDIYNLLKKEAEMFQTMEDWIMYTEQYARMLQEKQNSNKKEGVCLSTLHSSKGLEWENVLIIDA